MPSPGPSWVAGPSRCCLRIPAVRAVRGVRILATSRKRLWQFAPEGTLRTRLLHLRVGTRGVGEAALRGKDWRGGVGDLAVDHLPPPGGALFTGQPEMDGASRAAEGLSIHGLEAGACRGGACALTGVVRARLVARFFRRIRSSRMRRFGRPAPDRNPCLPP
jgi:hypothetical protein